MDRAEHAGKLFIISGPSGAGKGTICKRLIEDTKVEISVSMTTRNPRPGEVDGVSYYFTTKEEFEKEIHVLLEIDIQGALHVKNAYPNGIFIFILPPSMAELRKRITGRGSETEEAINLRLSQTLKEVSYIDKYDYCVVNGELEEAVSRVKAIVVAEHSRVSQNVYRLIEQYKEEV